MKYNLYDFDGTIYDGDSGIDIMLFAMKKYPRIIIPSFWALFLYIIGVIDKVNFKSRIFSFVRYVDDIDSFVDEFWHRNEHKIKIFWKEKNSHKNDIIISASCDFWLEPIAKKYKVFDLFATKIDLKTGRVIGNNCHGKEKVELFRNKYPKSIINSMYTDSKNDYPLIREAKKGYLVCKNDIYDYDDFFKNKKSIFEKYHEIISYLIFGVLTVFINIIVKYIMWGFFCDPKIDNYFNQQFPVDLSWFIAVLFAYLTNKKYVFMSNNGNNSIEFISFFLSRIFTLILEKVLTFIFVTKLSITEGVSFLFITLFIQFIVIVLNYVCSKIFVFKKK